jgi:hypothetical protein
MIFLSPLVAAAGLLLASSAIAEPVKVKVGRTTVVGDYNATTGVEAFLGVKYANHKRFERPVMVDYRDPATVNATVHAPACAQVNNAVCAFILRVNVIDTHVTDWLEQYEPSQFISHIILTLHRLRQRRGLSVLRGLSPTLGR